VPSLVALFDRVIVLSARSPRRPFLPTTAPPVTGPCSGTFSFVFPLEERLSLTVQFSAAGLLPIPPPNTLQAFIDTSPPLTHSRSFSTQQRSIFPRFSYLLGKSVLFLGQRSPLFFLDVLPSSPKNGPPPIDNFRRVSYARLLLRSAHLEELRRFKFIFIRTRMS